MCILLGGGGRGGGGRLNIFVKNHLVYLPAFPYHTPRRELKDVVVTRGLLNKQLKCVGMLLRNFLYSLDHCIAPRGTSISWKLNNIYN